MVIQADQDRLTRLLTEALPLLCKSGLSVSSQFCIEALIGITLGANEVFLVSIKETVKTEQDLESLQQKSVAVDVTKVPTGGVYVRKRRSGKRPRSKGSISSDCDTDVYQNDSDQHSKMKREKLTTNEVGNDTPLSDADSSVHCDAYSTDVLSIKQEPEFVHLDPGFDVSSHSLDRGFDTPSHSLDPGFDTPSHSRGPGVDESIQKQDDSLANTPPSDQEPADPSYFPAAVKQAKSPGAKGPGNGNPITQSTVLQDTDDDTASSTADNGNQKTRWTVLTSNNDTTSTVPATVAPTMTSPITAPQQRSIAVQVNPQLIAKDTNTTRFICPTCDLDAKNQHNLNIHVPICGRQKKLLNLALHEIKYSRDNSCVRHGASFFQMAHGNFANAPVWRTIVQNGA